MAPVWPNLKKQLTVKLLRGNDQTRSKCSLACFMCQSFKEQPTFWHWEIWLCSGGGVTLFVFLSWLSLDLWDTCIVTVHEPLIVLGILWYDIFLKYVVERLIGHLKLTRSVGQKASTVIPIVNIAFWLCCSSTRVIHTQIMMSCSERAHTSESVYTFAALY